MLLFEIKEDEALTVLDSKGNFWNPEEQPRYIVGFHDPELAFLSACLLTFYHLTNKEELLRHVEDIQTLIRKLQGEKEVGSDISWDDASEQ